MTNTNDILLRTDFNYQTVSIDNLFLGDDYSKVDFDKIDDIYVAGQNEGMGLFEKYVRLKSYNGYIHIKAGLSIEVDQAKLKSLRLRDTYLLLTNLKTRKDIEQKLGVADYELTDGTMWVFDFVVDAKVLVYKALKLYLHVDPKTDTLKEIRLGDINEPDYY